MITVNSLSGGKTSSYIAAHYPADNEVFALVCMDDHNSNAGSKTFKIDKKVRQMVNDKLQKYCSDQHEFVCTAEDPITIKTMFDLEQYIGREIIWLRGPGFQQTTFGKSMLPNKQHRWCTSIFKIEPIFRFLYNWRSLPCKMRIGFRADEADRANTFKDTFIMNSHCEMHIDENNHFQQKSNAILTYPVTRSGYSYAIRKKEVAFRIGEFPLIEAGIVQADIQRYWQDKPVEFAADSNCQFCFWKHPMQLRNNFDIHPGIMHTAMVLEAMQGGTLHASLSMRDIKNIAPQLDLFKMRGGGCHGGYCTS
ncbi:hypothetical protein [Mucilaginibacter endophyticus]|uniref:hypothetical protein n=1 Tax=Mucilaginibacter endophyticus TaxID=2675003 RepID=UPI000E0D51C1|nr:hypothetical protein [Mucilaginibacter endophyticus]